MSDSSGFTEAALNSKIAPSIPTLSDTPSCESWNYEATVKKVEEIMARIEAGELELADVFDEFAMAVEYLQQCETFLTQRQKQMDLLIETLTDETEF